MRPAREQPLPGETCRATVRVDFPDLAELLELPSPESYGDPTGVRILAVEVDPIAQSLIVLLEGPLLPRAAQGSTPWTLRTELSSAGRYTVHWPGGSGV